MEQQVTKEQQLALALAQAWTALEKRLDHSLGAIRGISLAEYRLLRALADAPGARASRVRLAEAIGLTPSGVTRALRPLEKLGFVSTARSERDARLAIAALTPAGHTLVDEASAVVNETMTAYLDRHPGTASRLEETVKLLGTLAG